MKYLRPLTVVLLALSALFLPHASSPAGASVSCGTWSTAPNLNTARSVFGHGGVAGGKIHVFDGLASGGTSALHDHEAFDGTSWSTEWAPSVPLTPMPTQRNQFVTGTVGGKIYAISGDKSTGCCNFTNANEEYDPSTNNWASRAPIPTPREIFAAAVLEGKIYAIGGSTPLEDAFEVYTPSSDSWLSSEAIPTPEVQPLPEPRGAMAAAAASGKVFVISGGTAGGCDTSVRAYDPNTDTWDTTLSPLPACRTNAMAATMSGKIFVFGGGHSSCTAGSGTPPACDDVFMYDPDIDEWYTCTESMPTARQSGAAVVYEGAIYVIGGARGGGPAPAVSAVEVFTPSGPAQPVCGNGVLEAGEECDDGNTQNGDGCSSQCQIEAVTGVGGIVEIQGDGPGSAVESAADSSDGSSGRNYVAIAGLTAPALIILILSLSYARRRWLR